MAASSNHAMYNYFYPGVFLYDVSWIQWIAPSYFFPIQKRVSLLQSTLSALSNGENRF